MAPSSRSPRNGLGSGRLCTTLIYILALSCVYGNEVYLKSITIFKTHDFLVKPTIYFTCQDDDRSKVYIKVTKKNKELDVPEESVALTHITSDLCRNKCAIYDEDNLLFDKDDIFGSFFTICDSDFDSDTHIATKSVQGEVKLELYCPECNPGTSVMEILNPPVEESHSGKRKSRQLPLIVTVFVVCGVTLGFLLGFFVHKVYRAWIDVEAEDMRRQFQTLYADPLTEIDDLPTDWPKHGNGTFESIARTIRSWTVRRRDSRPPRPVVPMQQVVPHEDPDES